MGWHRGRPAGDGRRQRFKQPPEQAASIGTRLKGAPGIPPRRECVGAAGLLLLHRRWGLHEEQNSRGVQKPWAQGFPPTTASRQVRARLRSGPQPLCSHLCEHACWGACLPGELRLTQVQEEARAAARAGQLADWLACAARGAGQGAVSAGIGAMNAEGLHCRCKGLTARVRGKAAPGAKEGAAALEASSEHWQRTR